MFNRRPIPYFDSEDEEREFWATHDSVDYIDWSKARRLDFPNLKLPKETVSIQLPKSLLNDLKLIANNRDMSCPSLVETFLSEIDWSRPRRIFLPCPNPSAIPISIQLPESLLADLEMIASSEDMPCQSLVESLLTERVAQELSKRKDKSQ